MESRSHALIAGLFTLLLIVAGAVGAVWVSKKNIPLVPYELVATSPVTGLSVQSAVRYQGVPVGRVNSLRFVPEKPGQVRILIGVDPKTPLTESSWAEIVTAGVTGISNIELRDDGKSSKLLVSSATDMQLIPIRPSFLERLSVQTTAALPAIDRILTQVEKVASDENIAALQKSLQNVALVSEQIRESVRALDPGLKKIPDMIERLVETTKRVDAAVGEIGKLAVSSQETIRLLNAPNGPMQQASQSLQSIQDLAAQLRASTLPEVSMLSNSMSDAARSFSVTARQLGQAPQSLIFGPPRAAPGPGEPGFAGFGSTSR
jgi:phospholipid/cholesterol/gamma-HCH transport system substrate-binding protein